MAFGYLFTGGCGVHPTAGRKLEGPASFVHLGGKQNEAHTVLEPNAAQLQRCK